MRNYTPRLSNGDFSERVNLKIALECCGTCNHSKTCVVCTNFTDIDSTLNMENLDCQCQLNKKLCNQFWVCNNWESKWPETEDLPGIL